ncbi:MAG: PaaX family transcriptional regulator C-terminal domain-containing protein [Ilumatobacter sp.]|uniref:PaaX family transcriptional regulator n=1 Tax=Ilumatobacter sp. TaxID=1967498 RepID=UPI00391BC2AA
MATTTRASGAANERSTRNRRPKSLILDVFGRYSAQFQGWIAVSDLIPLMELLGVDEQATRSAVSRMTRRGLMKPEVRNKVRGYRTTPEADALLADGDRRIYASVEPASPDDGWVLVSFSLPERDRDKRHVLRSKLMWHGMGNLGSGLWIGPARILPEVVDTLDEGGFAEFTDVFRATYEGLGDPRDLVARSWDLDDLASSYQQFIDEYEPIRASLARRRSAVPGVEAFALYTRALHEWRKFPYLDPGLPESLIGVDWPGRGAADLFAGLRSRLEPSAFDYVESIVRRRSAD